MSSGEDKLGRGVFFPCLSLLIFIKENIGVGVYILLHIYDCFLILVAPGIVLVCTGYEDLVYLTNGIIEIYDVR